MTSWGRRWVCMNQEVWGKVHPELQYEVLEDPEEWLQPDMLHIDMHQGLPLTAERTGVRQFVTGATYTPMLTALWRSCPLISLAAMEPW